ncbi:MAG: DEAD/DEAH box helicase, partial [Pseudomonadota bacterium]
LVLDEADQMLDMGFIPALRKIAALLPEARQTLLFSATMPKQMAELSATYLTDPVRIEVSPVGRAADKIAQTVHFVDQKAKTTLLKDLLAEHRAERALVFCRTKHGAERLMKQLVAADFAAASIHGNKSQGQRDRALKSFKAGKTTVLVATDVAARGIDVPGVRFVYNYELPNVAENYVHRIGRTARAGADGAAVALCAPHEMADLRAIEKAMKQAIPVAGGEPFAEQGATAAKPGRKPGTRRRRPRRPGRGGKPSRIAA